MKDNYNKMSRYLKRNKYNNAIILQNFQIKWKIMVYFKK